MKKFQKKYIALFLIVISVACSSGINLFSNSDEVALGKRFDQEIKSHPEQYPMYKCDPSVLNYIDSNIFREILNSPEVKKENVYNYQLQLIADDSTLNAFAVPGGYVYVYTGLLKYLDSDAALAGVLAHEIAHVERRHATQRITSAYGISILLSIVLGSNPSQIEEIVANLFTGLTLLANSRANEDESDKFSIAYLKDTRFYPGSVKFFFERMRDDGKVSKGGSGIATFLSTHPDPIDRISTTENRLKEMGIPVKSYTSRGNNILHDEYERNIRSKLN